MKFCAILFVLGLLVTPALAGDASGKVSYFNPKTAIYHANCTATDIENSRRGCAAQDCDYDVNGCDVIWAKPPASGWAAVDELLHRIFGHRGRN